MPHGLVFNIQRFSISDGPGIRTTVFMKGCSLRCYWCHNPESQSPVPQIQFFKARCIGCGSCVQACPAAQDGQAAFLTERCTGCGACAEVCYAGALELCGRRYEADDLADTLLVDHAMMTGATASGGVTFSGGEPLMQAEFVAAVLKRLKESGVHTAVETAANVERQALETVLPFTDLFLCDIKAIDAEKHRAGTGADNRLILDNLRFLSEAVAASGAEILFRVPVIPQFNADEGSIRAIGEWVHTLPGQRTGHQVELLPFHNMCVGKYDALGRVFQARKINPPSAETMRTLTNMVNLEAER
jgi:pyruvate formate lyase activating enzyme